MALGFSYLPSNRVWIFPCANRTGTNDVESHLFTERNLSNLSYTAMGQDQVTKVTDLTGNDVQVEFILAGYYVRVKFLQSEITGGLNPTIWASLKLGDKEIVSTENQTSPMIQNYEYDSNNDPDPFILDIDNYFKGIKFTDTQQTGSGVSASLCIRNAGSWKTGEYYLPTASDKTNWDTAQPGTVTQITAGAGLNTSDNTAESATKNSITDTGTLYLTTTGITAGTYQGINIDKYGRAIAASNQHYTKTVTIDGITTSTADSNNNGTLTRLVTCTTAASTAAKTVSAPTGFPNTLSQGLEISVFFINSNTATTNLTLQVGSTAAKTIALGTNTSSSTTTQWYKLLSGLVKFVYYGSYWTLVLPYTQAVDEFPANTSVSSNYPVLFSNIDVNNNGVSTTNSVQRTRTVYINPNNGSLHATTLYENGSTLTSKYNTNITITNNAPTGNIYLTGYPNSIGANPSTLYTSSNVYVSTIDDWLYTGKKDLSGGASRVITEADIDTATGGDFKWENNKLKIAITNASAAGAIF